ncbi:hypothetical protein R5R35_012882 [Gryllus longicercus]|uniref:COMM domain-containing protein 5 n=1 Tax=Gryllus longicercus TaxID=2509291 RepID=A0AAN9W4G7_9ORTH
MSKKSPGGPVSSLLKYPQDSRQQICRSLMQLAVNTIEGKPIGEGALEKFSVQYSDINVFDLYAIVLNIVKVIMKLPVGHTKTEALKERLKESLFPEEVAAEFMNILCDPRRETFFNKVCHNTYNSKLTRLRWRIDITISSSILSRVLEPCICIEMILSNGSVIVFELSMAKFHYLRYNVATVLKEMESLQNRRHVKGAV